MEQKRISCGTVLDKLPPLSTKYPWFIAQNLEAKQVDDHQIFYTIHNPQLHYRCQIPELLGRQIRACFHGWMILSNHPMWFLWNPLTSKLIRLPPLRSTQEDLYSCCLSSPPDDPSSIFLLTTDKRPTITFCQLDRKRKNLRWTEMSYAEQLRSITHEEKDCFLGNMTCCDGKVYALHSAYDSDHFVIEVEIVVKEKEVLIRLRPFLKLPCVSITKFNFFEVSLGVTDFLKGGCRDLFHVSVTYDDDTCEILDMKLFKLDMTEKKWEEMEDLKEAVFFMQLGGDHIYYSPEIATELGGYVHILDEMGKVLYSCDVKNRTLSLSSTSSLVQSNDMSSWALLECRLKDNKADFREEKKDKKEEMVVKVVAEDDDKFDSTLVESHLFKIPFHMLEKIMEYSVGVEYMKFRATCKSCHLASPSIQWSNKTLLRRLQTYSLLSPWLMVLNIQQGTITFTDPVFGDKYYMRIPKELIGYSQIYCSKYGWLLMHKDFESMVFFNPFTRDIIKLPPLALLSCCFSAAPTSPGCMVLGCTPRGRCYIHFVGQEAIWRSLGIAIGVDRYSFLYPTLHDQDLYALCDKGGLDVYRKHGEVDYSWEHCIAKPPSSSCGSSTQYLLAKCDKHLLLVMMGKFGEFVEVFKLNNSGREWEKIDCLGKHSIYICDAACVCVEAKTPQMENNIYFARLHPDNEKIVFYSLETCRYHTSNDQNIQESLGDLFRTAKHLDPHSWIEPSWS